MRLFDQSMVLINFFRLLLLLLFILWCGNWNRQELKNRTCQRERGRITSHSILNGCKSFRPIENDDCVRSHYSNLFCLFVYFIIHNFVCVFFLPGLAFDRRNEQLKTTNHYKNLNKHSSLTSSTDFNKRVALKCCLILLVLLLLWLS